MRWKYYLIIYGGSPKHLHPKRLPMKNLSVPHLQTQRYRLTHRSIWIRLSAPILNWEKLGYLKPFSQARQGIREKVRKRDWKKFRRKKLRFRIWKIPLKTAATNQKLMGKSML